MVSLTASLKFNKSNNCVCVCVCACVRACVRVCVCVWLQTLIDLLDPPNKQIKIREDIDVSQAGATANKTSKTKHPCAINSFSYSCTYTVQKVFPLHLYVV